jgi:hypothetical protein
MSPRIDLKSDDPAREREQDGRHDCKTLGFSPFAK